MICVKLRNGVGKQCGLAVDGTMGLDGECGEARPLARPGSDPEGWGRPTHSLSCSALHPDPSPDGSFHELFTRLQPSLACVTMKPLCTNRSPSVPRTQAKVLMSALLSFQRSTEAPWPQFYKATAVVVRRKRQQCCVVGCTV